MENWRNVIGYEGIYQISDFGNVRRIAYFDNASIVHHGNMLFVNMKPTKSKFGYLRIKLMYHGKPSIKLIHRLVASAFIYNVNNKPCINHIDGNKENNHVLNLEWCSYSENGLHANKIGLRNMKNKKGSKSVGMFDLITGEILKIFPSTHEAARQTGL